LNNFNSINITPAGESGRGFLMLKGKMNKMGKGFQIIMVILDLVVDYSPPQE
jgi:hypothetical protein